MLPGFGIHFVEKNPASIAIKTHGHKTPVASLPMSAPTMAVPSATDTAEARTTTTPCVRYSREIMSGPGRTSALQEWFLTELHVAFNRDTWGLGLCVYTCPKVPDDVLAAPVPCEDVPMELATELARVADANTRLHALRKEVKPKLKAYWGAACPPHWQ